MTTQDASPLQDSLDLGKRVIREEAAGLRKLEESLGQDFVDAVELLLSIPGRVGVTGMGKSGHVGKKISATMSSTGTPSYFIHPSEASHGDLGSVQSRDALLALSNSGESYEMTDIISYAARRDIPIIAITRNPQSFLGRQARIVLTLPDVGEAGPLGCAPTTSAAMTLVLGDALAMALLQMRGFTAEDFAHYHPGGQLGRKLLLVEDIMHGGDALPLVGPDMLMGDALVIMTTKGFGCLGIVEDGRLLGLIADGDLRRNMSANLLNRKTSEIMTPGPVTIEPKAPAAKALGLMNRKGITSVMVLDENGRVCGLVHMHDCLRAGIE